MQPEHSVHDKNVYAYTVDCEGQTLVLHTAFRDSGPNEFTDIVFRGVFAHHFEIVLQGNILFDVVEVEVASLVRDSAELFGPWWQCGWPLDGYGGDLDKLVSALKAASARAFTINSSYGLSGWVLPRSAERVSRGEPAKVA